MKIIGKILASAALLSATAAASGAAQAADIVSSGVIYGGTTQKRAVCYFSNAAQSTITLNNFAIVNQNGTTLALAINECSSALLGLKSCGIAADVPSNATHLCRAKVSDKTNLRGTIEIRDVNQAVLNAQDLR